MIFKTKPLAHQMKAFEMSKDKKEFAYLMEMGTGKTKVLLDVLFYSFQKKITNAALILAPKGTYMTWVRDEIPKHLAVDCQVEYWSADLTEKKKGNLEKFANDRGSMALKILVMNTESIAFERAFDIAYDFMKNHHVLLCIDESTDIKNPKAKCTKAALKLAALAVSRRIMTGTPITQSPLDLFTQFQFLSPSILKYTSFYSFKAQYATTVTMNLGTRYFQKVVGYRNLEELQKRIEPHSFRILKSECLDLPEKVYTTRYVELHPAQKKAYSQLSEFAMAQFTKGVVSAPHALTLIMRLHQILCGHTKLDSGQTVDVVAPKDNPRLQTLMEVASEITGKSLIWCHYQRDVVNITKALSDVYGTASVMDYYGPTTQDDRELAVKRFQNDPTLRFLVGTPSAGGKGLTLTAANTVIYYSNSYNLETRLQSEDRAHRIGQRNPVTYVDIITQKTVDEKILDALKGKKNLADFVLDKWREVLL